MRFERCQQEYLPYDCGAIVQARSKLLTPPTTNLL